MGYMPLASRASSGRRAKSVSEGGVLETIQGVGESGLYVKSVSVSVANSRFTIRLSKAVTASTIVGWFIVN